MPLNADELPRDLQKKLGIKTPRSASFTMEAIRRHSIRVLAVIADLTQDQRRRVLDHAQKVNRT